MTDCPHGNHPEERCAPCVAAGRLQPGEQWTRRYNTDNIVNQQKADTDLRGRAETQRKRRHEVDKARAEALKSQEQRLEYGQET